MAASDEQPLLLDTHAAIWLADGRLSADLTAKLMAAARAERLFISTVSALEIGFLSRPERPESRRLVFDPDPLSWFDRLLERAQLRLVELTPVIAIRSSFLPGEIHKDPIDRMLVATARELQLTLVTRDAAILAYSAAGHLRTLTC